MWTELMSCHCALEMTKGKWLHAIVHRLSVDMHLKYIVCTASSSNPVP